MLLLALILFSIAILLGFYLLSFVLQNKNTPKGIAFIHGPIAAFGLIILIVYAIVHSPKPLLSILLLTLAAIGGLVLISLDLMGKTIPKIFAIGHGLIALLGFFLLVLFTYA